ncbi:MAG: hypothetical protein NXI24_18685 [bacterium]|nr:hypothetical protein [bacterium]
MELLALALVNVVTAGVMYVFFSMRFSRAVRSTVEQSRKNSLIRELKENVELTIEYINASLDTMDQKTRSFYQLLRRSEELTAQLEALHLEQMQAQAEQKPARSSGGRKKAAARSTAAKPGKSGKAAAAKSASRAPAKSAAKSSAKKSAKTTGDAAADSGIAPAYDALAGDAFAQPDPEVLASPLAGRDGPEDQEREFRDYHPDRVLEELGGDRLEISAAPESVESAYRGGERSRPRTAPHIPTASDEQAAARARAGGVFGRIGGIARRILGIDAMPAPGNAADLQSDVESDSKSAARFSVPRLSPEELERPVPGEARRGPAPPTKRTREAGTRPAGAPPATRSAAESESMLPRLDRWELSEEAGDAARAQQRSARPGRVTGAGYGPAFSAQPELPPPAEILKAEGLGDVVLEGQPDGEARRADVIRTLLRYGYRPGDISRATGIALPEVELVASLPESGRRPRRQRLNAPVSGSSAAPGAPSGSDLE